MKQNKILEFRCPKCNKLLYKIITSKEQNSITIEGGNREIAIEERCPRCKARTALRLSDLTKYFSDSIERQGDQLIVRDRLVMGRLIEVKQR